MKLAKFNYHSRKGKCNILRNGVNPLHDNCLFLYSLKTSENQSGIEWVKRDVKIFLKTAGRIY